MLKTICLGISVCLCFKTEACSRVLLNTSPVAKVVTRTMDLYVDDRPQLIVYPEGLSKNGDAGPGSLEWVSKYGSIGILSFAEAISDGVNTQGLAAHLLYLDASTYGSDDFKPKLSNAKWAEYMLDNFATVDEVLAHLKDFQVISTIVADRHWPVHLILEDASGDSAILEYVKGKLIVHHSKEYRVVTNDPTYDEQLRNLKKYQYFNVGGKLPLPGDANSLSRFTRASAFLKTLTAPQNYVETMAFILGVIATVQVPFGAKAPSEQGYIDAWPTRWISAADLTNKTYYIRTAFNPNIIWIDMSKIKFTKGARISTLDLAKLQGASGESSSLLKK